MLVRDAEEGIDAFLQKREPVWEGRWGLFAVPALGRDPDEQGVRGTLFLIF